MVEHGGRLLLLGGAARDGERLSSVEWYDPRSGRCSAAPPLSVGRDLAAAVTL